MSAFNALQGTNLKEEPVLWSQFQLPSCLPTVKEPALSTLIAVMFASVDIPLQMEFAIKFKLHQLPTAGVIIC